MLTSYALGLLLVCNQLSEETPAHLGNAADRRGVSMCASVAPEVFDSVSLIKPVKVS